MGPDEKDTGVIVIYEEPDGPLLGTVDGEIPEIDLEEERPGVYLEGEVIEEIRNRVEKMIVQEAEPLNPCGRNFTGISARRRACSPSGSRPWRHRLRKSTNWKPPCAGRRAITGQRSTDTDTPRKRGPARSTKRRSWPGIGRRSCKCCG